MVFYIETLFAPPVAAGEHHLLVDHIQVDRGVECFPPRGWEWQDVECSGSGHGHGGGESDSRNPAEGPGPHARHGSHAHGEYGAVAADGHNGAAGGKHGLLSHMQHTRVHLPPSPDKERRRHKHSHSHGHQEPHEPQPPSQSLYHSLSSQKAGSGRASPNPNPTPERSASPAQALLQKHHGEHSEEDHDDHIHSLAGALCLLAALGFHSVIEGLGLATASYHDGDHGGRVRA